MRGLLGVVGLLLALALVGLLAVRQLRVLHPGANVAASAPDSARAPMLSGSGSGSVAEQSRALQKQVTDDVNKALTQGAARDQDADK